MIGWLESLFKLWRAIEQEAAFLDPGLMVERVRSTLLESLPAGQVSMQVVCRKLAVSARTLQRRLQAEGTTFQQTLDSVRDALARHYLGHTDMSSAEISFLLGYEDANSFARAFQAWSGKTPQTVRSENSAQAQLVAG